MGGIKADMESASHIVLQKFKGILHLKTCWGMHRVNGLPEHAMKFSPSHYCVLLLADMALMFWI